MSHVCIDIFNLLFDIKGTENDNVRVVPIYSLCLYVVARREKDRYSCLIVPAST
jgi:hypothetical protein